MYAVNKRLMHTETAMTSGHSYGFFINSAAAAAASELLMQRHNDSIAELPMHYVDSSQEAACLRK